MKLPKFWKLAFLVGAVLAAGCSSHRALAGSSARIFYSDARSVSLIPPWENTFLTEENQHLSGTFGDRNFSGESWMLLSDSVIHVMLFGNIGNTLAELVYTKDSVSFESSVMDVKKVKPEYILADIQFCYYPKEVLERNFSSAFFLCGRASGRSLDAKTPGKRNDDFKNGKNGESNFPEK